MSFASNDGARVLYFYNCDDEKAAASLLPPPASHMLLLDSVEDEDTLLKKCKHMLAWEDVYANAIKLDSIKNSKPDGFRIQLPLFVKGL